MTKDEGQKRYAQLATLLGDWVVKGWAVEERIAQIREDLKTLDKAMADTKETEND